MIVVSDGTERLTERISWKKSMHEVVQIALLHCDAP